MTQCTIHYLSNERNIARLNYTNEAVQFICTLNTNGLYIKYPTEHNSAQLLYSNLLKYTAYYTVVNVIIHNNIAIL